MIAILCYSCSTHIANTDVGRLDWPLTGEMFAPAYPGWYLRPGPLNLDVFCPACGQFPFSHDPYVAGGNAVGKNLNVRGADGKPQVLTVKQILMGGQAVSGETLPGQQAPQGIRPMPLAPSSMTLEFPCPSCGAKKRFHKKGCVTQATEEEKAKAPVMAEVIQKQVFSDPHLLAMEARVSAGPERSEQPTAEDLKELERDRERRASERPDPALRPGEGYAPPVAR